MTETVSVFTATVDDAAAIAAIRNAAAECLTREFGQGHWSGVIAAAGVLRGITSSRVLVARNGESILGTLSLAAKKPWALDPRYFTGSKRPLYLVDMAVAPAAQRRGIGRLLLASATTTAEAWKADAIRLDAYDHVAGAGAFYAKCGFREVGRAAYRAVPLIYYELVI